ncbi:hypothetical protein [Actinoplanes xinjiangensis]|uniref:Uncharacterized protein n=1 Tax=Actinoplanes xinjiangensis TaxID=512350 RepID=A0A316FDE3_9ACTN|nr:hypothetical protein [Actinoplanes xinjiangensis]PWK46901.1 hypothetical protein BC793_10815 [Actinoplanes xinjiangensis]GIF40059.1 hypothetical protein Axi01nite_43700 [Actinoplanes xinjiangensis]
MKKRLVTAVVAVVLVVAGGTLVADRGAWLLDQRAYPGSRLGSSLDELLAQFGLRLPGCPVEDLRYWSGDNIEDTFYLTFAAEPSCVTAFVTDNGLTPGEPLPGDSLALGKDGRVQKWRWPFAEAGLYATYSGAPKPEVEVDVVVDPPGRHVYAYAFETG